MPLADPFSLRLSEAHIQYLDDLCERRSYISRPTAIRALIEEARRRDARRTRQQPTTAA